MILLPKAGDDLRRTLSEIAGGDSYFELLVGAVDEHFNLCPEPEFVVRQTGECDA
jgi:hypothetical protein